jgi:hypothetical protein
MEKKLYPKEWDAKMNEKNNGWKNSPRVLSEIVTAMNDDTYIEDENEMMEYIDLALEFIKKKYFSGAVGEKI